jgi:hypothetical protein
MRELVVGAEVPEGGESSTDLDARSVADRVPDALSTDQRDLAI